MNLNKETLLTVGAVGMSQDGPAGTGIGKHYEQCVQFEHHTMGQLEHE